MEPARPLAAVTVGPLLAVRPASGALAGAGGLTTPVECNVTVEGRE